MSDLSVFSETLKPPVMSYNQSLEAFKQDKDFAKIFLGHRDCRTDDGLPWVIPLIKTTQQHISNDPTLNHEHLPLLGLPEFTRVATELAIGKHSIALIENRAGGIQTPGGTGALWLGAKFLQQWYKVNFPKQTAVYVSLPAWDTHGGIFQNAGFTDIRSYHYWDCMEMGIGMKELVIDLEDAPDNSIVVLHCTPNNPTGMDFTPQEWIQIANLMQKKKLFPFFHLSAQGLASGDLDRDVLPFRFFIEQGFELFCAQSFSKNFGLYEKSVGNLIVVAKNNKTLLSIRSQLEIIIRLAWWSPPALGARIVATVLNNPAILAEWKENIKEMAEHIMLMRLKLKEKLRTLGTLGTWEHLTTQMGLYSFSGLNASQVDILRTKRHVYLGANGQINMSSLNSGNIDYVAQCIHEAVNLSYLG
ncbi:putative aspartate aminotransferase, cytoplasmic 2 [Rhinatrema bivittatum]|uniref:putative aspartate aminotransferase, cytoplasmic 2 n=1 Tax=Rhinatrema bivittatum TaxID=194408 RepID=UPI00112C978D|nr:putative aspartate aminotransferase, cytoplasmic 2 [Rhinatrema bivittatum]